MVVYRGLAEIRVERSESQARVMGWVLLGGLAGLGVFGVLEGTAEGADRWTGPGIFLLFGLLALILTRNNHGQVLVIRPGQIGHGHMGRTIYWLDRGGLSSVSIESTEMVVHLHRSDGRPGEAIFLSPSFDRAELVAAFEEAGIPVR